MSESSRNPSPPPLTETEREAITGDFIGDTVFSKQWLLDLLLKLYKHDEGTVYTSEIVEKENSAEKATSTAETKSDSDIDSITDVAEKLLNPAFENDLCQLWDMTANTDVCLFLYEHDAKNVLVDALKRTHSPRLMEVCFGILGNLLCVKEIRVSFSECDIFRKTNLQYLSVTDALSLVELTRLLCTALSCSTCSLLWLQDLSDSNVHVEQLIYLLVNTLNIDLLCHVVEILDILFDGNDEALDKSLDSDGLVTGAIEAFHPLKENGRVTSLVSLVHMFQAISTSNKGVEALLSGHCDRSLNFLKQCLTHNDTSMEMSPDSRLAFNASVISTLTCFLTDQCQAVLAIFNENITFLQNYTDYLLNKLTEIREDGLSLTNQMYMTIFVQELHQILAAASTSKFAEHFPFLRDFLKSEHLKTILLDVVGILKDIEYLKNLSNSFEKIIIMLPPLS